MLLIIDVVCGMRHQIAKQLNKNGEIKKKQIPKNTACANVFIYRWIFYTF